MQGRWFKLKEYHASKIAGIKKIEPRKSTHGKEFVYATSSKAMAMILSCHMSDLYSAIGGQGTKDNPRTIVERIPGIFNKYLHTNTNVYTLNGDDFYNDTSWEGEVVSDKEQMVIDEENIEDVYSEILKLEQDGIVKLYHYPERPENIPLDNSDLIAHWLNAEGISINEKVNQLMHVGKVYQNLQAKIFKESLMKNPYIAWKISYNILKNKLMNIFTNKLKQGDIRLLSAAQENRKIKQTEKKTFRESIKVNEKDLMPREYVEKTIDKENIRGE